MLKFDDFFHLPELDPHLRRMIADPRGMLLVAGLDPLPLDTTTAGVLPSGRMAVFRALVGELVSAAPQARVCVVAADRAAIRIPRSLRQRVTLLPVHGAQTYAGQIAAAVRRQADLLVIERLDRAGAPAALAAAVRGLPVVAQLDTVCRGADVRRHLLDLGVAADDLAGLTGVIAVHRMATLCPACRRAAPADPERVAQLRHAIWGTAGSSAEASAGAGAAEHGFCEAPGCLSCHDSGRQGDVAVFDVYQVERDPDTCATRLSRLTREQYMWHLARRGMIALDDLLDHDGDQLYRTYRLLSSSTHALASTNATLQRKLAELESANHVLQQRTAALLALQDLGQSLIRTTDLAEMVRLICRRARELCDADRTILYLLGPHDTAEVLAVSGWDEALAHRRVDAALLVCDDRGARPFANWPPGVPEQHADVAGFSLRAGLKVALVADGRQIGLMIVQSTQKARFTPGEVALLQSFANQAALAIQRATLIEARVRQERLERDLELARQVQQSVLPQVFPATPGYTFAARNEPARQVGGDFYDVFALGEERIGVVIADVSDKGMPAALYMALTRSLLLAEARRERSPRAGLLSVNQLLRELGDPHMFVTVFYGTIEVTTRRLTYARAGHDYPLLLRGTGVVTLGGAGMVLGCFDSKGLMLSEEQLDLLPADRLVLYTDGMTDVLAPNGERFGLDRLHDLLRARAGHDPAALCAELFDALAAYQATASQYDDMTLLVIGID